MNAEHLVIHSEAETVALGAKLAHEITGEWGGNAVIFLRGDLGAGKTTLVRAILRALGHSGTVKSPTYTLLEPYVVGGLAVYHFDLYRVADSLELEFVGVEEIIENEGIKLFEWPERAHDWLPQPDIDVAITFARPETWNVAGIQPGADEGCELNNEVHMDKALTTAESTRHIDAQPSGETCRRITITRVSSASR